MDSDVRRAALQNAGRDPEGKVSAEIRNRIGVVTNAFIERANNTLLPDGSLPPQEKIRRPKEEPKL